MSFAPQCASAALLVRPACFGYNVQTAVSNRFQRNAAMDAVQASAAARAEFDGLCAGLLAEGVQLCIVEDTPEPAKPDAVFPNNWVSFHRDGTVVLYPMQAVNRRCEQRLEIIDAVAATLGFVVRRRLDLRHHQWQGRFLEGTGSLVLDHGARIAFACRSARTDAALVQEWAHLMEYEPVVFDAADATGAPIYHTNVMLHIGSRCAVVAASAIAAADRDRVLERLSAGGRELIFIDGAAMAAFAGNLLEFAVWDEALGDCTVLVMSSAARAALEPQQFGRLSACVDTVLAVPVPTIEALGGGSVRCMLAEVPPLLTGAGAGAASGTGADSGAGAGTDARTAP